MSRAAPVKLDVIASLTTFGELLRYFRQHAKLTHAIWPWLWATASARLAAWIRINACNAIFVENPENLPAHWE